MRFALPVLLVGLAAGPALAQGTSARAATPDAAALARLGLTADWSTFIPVQNRRDGIARVQAVDTAQMFVQTKGGLLMALDAGTGREQWKFQFPAGNTEGFNVAVNRNYVFSVNVAKLFCHQRFTGGLEFEMDLPEATSVGPVCDGDRFYVVFSSGRVGCYDLPPAFKESVAAIDRMKADLRKKGVRLKEDEVQARESREGRPLPNSLADGVADRNAGRQFPAVPAQPEFERFSVPASYFEAGFGFGSNQPTYSVAALQQVTPPYFVGGLNKVVSVAMLPSVKQPYTSRPDYLTYNQLTPSVAVIPPSIARLFELSNLSPPPFKPTRKWVAEAGGVVYHDPVTNVYDGFTFDHVIEGAEGPILVSCAGGRYAGLRVRPSEGVWLTTDGKALRHIYPKPSEDEIRNERVKMPAVPGAGLSGPHWYGDTRYLFVPLGDGQVRAIGVARAGPAARSDRAATVGFNSNVGGPLNRKPVAAADGLYVGGDRSGTARINPLSGDVDWRTDGDVDRVAAVTDTLVFARDRRGDVLVYSKGKADPNTLMARPLGTLPAAAFNVNVANDTTDRLLLAADNGLLVCLREANAAANKPKVIAPPPPVEKKADEPKPGDPPPPDKKADDKPPEEKK